MIHIVLGTKAQLVKMAPVMFRMQSEGVLYNFIFTGQHKETIKQMLNDFRLKSPDAVLYEGKDITSVWSMAWWSLKTFIKAIFSSKKLFKYDQHGIVLVHGDTLSTLLGALMGRVAGLKVGHIESGLRSHNIFHPFPEEMIRIMTFRLSDILFCPGTWAVQNVKHLSKEIIDTKANTLYDTLLMHSPRCFGLDRAPNVPYALVSLHRYENIFNRKRLESILDLLESVAAKHKLLFILHPATDRQLHRYHYYERLSRNENIELRKRYNHSDFLTLLKGCLFVVTDGGSLQEESYYLGIPCILLRKATERKEGIGENVVLSKYDAKIIEEFSLSYDEYRKGIAKLTVNPSSIILSRISEFSAPA